MLYQGEDMGVLFVIIVVLIDEFGVLVLVLGLM